jgi:hypothetical protein
VVALKSHGVYMRIISLSLGAVVASLAVSTAAGGAAAQSRPELITRDAGAMPAQMIFGRDTVGDNALLEKAQYLWGGRNYCWYDGGWQGPGYYWCGYAWRRGFGWGGPVGWHGWAGHGGGHGGGGFHGGGHVGGGHVGGGHMDGGHAGGGGHPGGGHAGGGHEGGGGHGGGGEHHH